MKIVGLTGGMGVGKTTVSKLLEECGYNIYNSDIRAKQLMVEDFKLKKELITLLGEESYIGNQLNRKYIAEKIFSDSELLKRQNALVHQAVKNDFDSWVKSLSNKGVKLCIKEAAILFESGSYLDCDYIIVVTAPNNVRIKRIEQRDHLNKEDILQRMHNQWPQEKLLEKADYQIINDSDLLNLELQVKTLNLELKNIQ